MQFTPSFLDELRGRIGLAELVGRKVRLTKRGREHVGLCPFHNEKTPSFAVVEEKGFFHCFGCGAHGDAIGFVMRAESLSFPEAVERLASEAGLPLPVFDPQERAKAEKRASLGDALELACKWYEEQLRKPVGRAGLEYLRRRGLDDETIGAFRLGFAPASGLQVAIGVDQARLVEAGLMLAAEDGRPARDFFRERVTFPIADRRGRVVAFGARALGDEKPKYLNSRDTELFHKGRTLYNLSKARGVASDTGRIVVAEGYMDVIAFHQAGIGSAVAPLGTALTEDQLQILWKIVPEPIVCLDGDAAGQRAAERAGDRALPLLAPGRSLRFALLPDGEDPDSLLRAHGPEALAKALEQTLPLAELMWRATLNDQPADTPERRAGLRQALLDRTKVIADPVVREYYQREFRDRFERSVAPAPAQPSRRQDRRGPPQRQSTGLLRRYQGNLADRREQALLAAILNRPELLAYVIDDLAHIDFANARLDSLRRRLVDIAAAGLLSVSELDRDNAATPAEIPQAHGPLTLDAAGLRSHLEQCGYATVLEGFGKPEVASLMGSIVRPATPLPDAIRKWKHIHDRHRMPEVEAELTRVGLHPEAAKSAEFFDTRLKPLQDEAVRQNRAANSLDC
jgi:DNA primase